MESDDGEYEFSTESINVSFDQMSDESISIILDRLPLSSIAQLSCTSTRMNRICNSPKFWRSIRINDEEKPVDSSQIASLCGKGTEIRNLSLNLNAQTCNPSILKLISKSCPYVVSLSLYLRNEPLINRSPGNNAFPIEDLLSFLTNSKYIRSFQFLDSLLIDDNHLVNVLPHLQMMREIDLSGCGSLSDSTLIKLAQQCPSLQLIDISRLPITGRCIKQIFRYCNAIRVFRANYCLEIQTDSFQIDQIESFSSIVELSVIDTPIKLDHVLNRCTSIKSLYASYSLHDSILIPFLLKSRSIEDLYIGSGARVTISSLLLAVQNSGSRLRSLTFHPLEDFAVPSDEVMRMICSTCKNLKNLSLAHTQEISTYWVIEAIKTLPLETISLFGWKNCNSSSLRLLIPHISRLKMFCISGCPKLTHQGIIGFLRSTTKLLVAKFEDTGANVKFTGSIHPDVIPCLIDVFPKIREVSPGILYLQ